MKPRQSKKTTPRKKGAPKGRHSLAILITALVVVVIIGGAALFSLRGFQSSETVWLRFARPISSDALRDTISSRLGSTMGMKTWLLWRIQGGDSVRGAYAVRQGDSPLRLSRRLARGYQDPVMFTFNNLRTIDDLAARVQQSTTIPAKEFIATALAQLQPVGFSREQLAAAFIPNSYEIYYTTDAQSLVNKLTTERNRFWDASRLAKAEAIGLTPVEVATVASIVEEETAKPDERPRVARLYLNRLKKGMKLQADPTVKFAIGDFSIRRLTFDMLHTPSPFNTYLNPGLPPGPIRIPEARTIDDVLNAPAHDYLYMCAREDFSGYHNFSTTFAEHSRNAQRYREVLDRRGIK